MGTVLLIVLFIGLLASFTTPTMKKWGYGPPGIIGLLLVLVLFLVITGHVPWTNWNWTPRS